jgi:pilus assembly protein Flp/PilA
MRILVKLLRNRRGATAIEYALVASLIAVAAITAFKNLGSSLNNTYTDVNSQLGSAS